MSKSKITVFQLFSIFFISRVLLNLIYTSDYSADKTMWNYVISCGVSLAATVVLCLPAYCWAKNNNGALITDNGILGKLPAFIYSLYFVLAGGYTLLSFEDFLRESVNPDISIVFITVLIVAFAAYGAYKGIEALARCSVIILVAATLAMIFLVVTLMQKLHAVNYPPLFENGFAPVFEGIKIMLARSFSVPCLAVLLPYTVGKRLKGTVIWSIALYATAAVIITVVTGVLGSFAETQSFPVYTAARIAEYGVLQRLDFIYLGICTAGMFVKIALFLLIISICAERTSGDFAYKVSIPLGGILMLTLSLTAGASAAVKKLLFSYDIWLWLTVAVGSVVPLIMLILKRPRHNVKKYACFILAALLCINMSGCSGAKQLDERLIVKGIGIDKSGDEYKITLQALVTEGSEEDGEKIQVVESSGKSVLDAMSGIVLKTGKEPMYGQNLFVILGRSAVQEDIENTLDFFVRYYDARPSVSVYMSESSAKDILTAKNESGLITAQSIDQLAQAEGISGKTVTTDILRLVASLQQDITDSFIPTVAKKEADGDNSEILVTGTAVFRDNKLTGTLTPSESMGALLIMGRFNEGSVTVSTDECMFSAEISNCITHVKVNNFKFDVNINVNAAVYEVVKGGGKSSGEYYNMIEKELKKLAEASLDKAITELQSDIFNFHNYLRKDNRENYKKLVSDRTLLDRKNVTVRVSCTAAP